MNSDSFLLLDPWDKAGVKVGVVGIEKDAVEVTVCPSLRAESQGLR
jgi:hypothetical protein